MSKTKMSQESTSQSLLRFSTTLSVFLSMFFWTTNLYMAFWLRRFFIGFAGVLAITYVWLYARDILQNKLVKHIVGPFGLLSVVLLLATSNTQSALFGHPLVHPCILSLLASVAIALFVLSLDLRKTLTGVFYGTVAWAVVNFIFWVANTKATMRLGFLDSQVIYAACVFAIGIIIGMWLYKNRINRSWHTVGGIGFLSVCLLLTQTRSALILLGAIMVWMFWSYYKRYLRLLAALSLGLVMLAVIMRGYFGRLYNMPYLVESAEYRLNLIQASVPKDKIKLLFGGGIGSIESNIHANGPAYPLLAQDTRDGIRFESSHNYFVDILVERGVIILGVFLWLIVLALRATKPNYSPVGVVQKILLFIVSFLFVNNINIQMEMTLWVCLLVVLYSKNRKRLDTVAT